MTHTGLSIDSAPASALLRSLAENPYDLTIPENLVDNGRMQNYVSRSAMFRLLYATQRVDDRILQTLQSLADQCGLVEQFKAMRRGAVMNTLEGFDSENRKVLHTACRDLFTGTAAEPDATGQAQVELAKLKFFLEELVSGKVCNARGEKFTTLLHIGIGGSDLGPRSMYEALLPFGRPGLRVRFISNVDPDDAARVLDGLDLSKCLVCIVSKSGTTLETLTNEQLVRERFAQCNLHWSSHCIAITGQHSPMDDPAKYLRSFYIYDYIGGRYSSTSMVGAVPLGFFLGYDRLLEFLRGASQIDQAAEHPDFSKNIPLLLAMLGVWNRNFLGASTLAILPYSQALHRFPAHLQQCDMESNGKSISRQGEKLRYSSGPILFGEPGTNGQHAFYQLLHQGTESVPIEFIGFKRSQYDRDCVIDSTSSQEKLLANMVAQAVAFASGQKHDNPNKRFAGNRPSSILMADMLTPETMGALLAIYEAKIVFQGFCWNINSFDQEGVQLGKVLAGKILDLLSGKEKLAAGPEIDLIKTIFEFV